MKKVTSLLCFVIGTLFFDLTPLSAQQVFRTTTSSVIGFLEYTPSDYNSNSDKYPVVIFLHGLGERGVTSNDPATLQTTISTVAKLGPPLHVKNGTSFPFILISPQLKNTYGGWPAWYVLEVIDYVKTYLRIDERRIHITGLSLGGGGCWVMAQDYTKLFATASPVCGSNNSPSKACNIARENLPVWAFHGDADATVPLTRSVNMVNAINACTPAPNPLAKMSIYAGVKHNAWDKAYYPDNTYHTPNIYQWLMSYTNTVNGSNAIPVASAGSDKSVILPTASVSFTGTATDRDGTISSYAWSKIKGPSATLSGTTSSTLNVSNLLVGTYIFKLQVTDNAGDTDSDYVKLTVTSSTNVAPVVNAGADAIITLPTSSKTITGSATDADGSIESYSWTQVSGPTATLVGVSSSTLTASGLVAGTYVFRLTAKDNAGASSSDEVSVKVNIAPVVSAGSDVALALPTNSTSIQGSASDNDGSIVSYTWSKVSGSSATMSGTTTSKLSLTGLVQGSYVFRLSAKDNLGATKSDDVAVIVNSSLSSSTPNVSPVANAGADQIISLPKNYATLYGKGSDSDGSIASYSWTKISGGTITLAGTSTSNLSISQAVSGVYVFRLTVKDNLGASSYDDIKVTFNYAPVVKAGADITVVLPATSVSLVGSATDPDGTIVSYSWVKWSGGVATLSNSSTPTVSLTGLAEGSYIFRLSARDNAGASRYDEVTVNVVAQVTASALSSVEVVEDPSIETERSGNLDLSTNDTFWKDKMVSIFDEMGNKIHEGQWTPAQYQTTFSKRGLYIYRVFSSSGSVDVGKIFIVQ